MVHSEYVDFSFQDGKDMKAQLKKTVVFTASEHKIQLVMQHIIL